MILAIIKEKAKPSDGDILIKKKFAWWPKRIENKVIWLEKYKMVFMYKVRTRLEYFPRCYFSQWIIAGQWELQAEQLINKK